MIEPRATYRVQLNAGFSFGRVAELADYFATLGVSHVYLSPVLQAAPGSTHGYDIVDPERVSDELGGPEGFVAMVDALHAVGVGVLLDIVPNHMAITAGNRWWWDVLENGPASVYASYFDVDWDPPEAKLRNVVLMPILGDRYGRVLEAGEITLAREGGAFYVHYADHVLPVAPRSLDTLLGVAADNAAIPARPRDDLASIATAFGRLPLSTATDRASVVERHRDKELLRSRLAELCTREVTVAAAIDDVIAAWNDDPDALDLLLERQNYRLAFWRTAADELDYRRFFDINELIALRVEDEEVFAATHGRVREWLRDGVIDGVRVDHVDGLREPENYLQRLAAPWIVVEKILAPGEQLRRSWPVMGTTGYDFTNQVLGVLVDPAGEAPLTACYAEVAGEDLPFAEVSRTARRIVMRTVLAADVRRITAWFARVCQHHRRTRDYTRHELADAVREVIVSFPVYRTYVDAPTGRVTDDDRRVVHGAVADAGKRRPDIDVDLLDFLGRVLLLEETGADEGELAMRFQQLTGAVMAKGVEDTAFYRYHRFVALNEVGGEPGEFGIALDEFHRANRQRSTQWPRSLVTTATHDTKRGEDVRARLAVLSEVPDAWGAAVRTWEARAHALLVEGLPDANARYLLWQTLVGAWPVPGDRVAAYMEKATREAKVHTSWTDPDPKYDGAMRRFIERALDDHELRAGIAEFVATIDGPGRANAITQLVLKLTVPGVPDLYQGTEMWDASLVDPDNRRPVDYEKRRAGLARGDHPKLRVVAALLALRQRRQELFGAAAQYAPIEAVGPAAAHVIAFVRTAPDGGEVVVIASRHRVRLEREGGWRATTLALGNGSHSDVLSGGTRWQGTIAMEDVLGHAPAAVLVKDGA